VYVHRKNAGFGIERQPFDLCDHQRTAARGIKANGPFKPAVVFVPPHIGARRRSGAERNPRKMICRRTAVGVQILQIHLRLSKVFYPSYEDRAPAVIGGSAVNPKYFTKPIDKPRGMDYYSLNQNIVILERRHMINTAANRQNRFMGYFGYYFSRGFSPCRFCRS
jgi:hypothetical protein